MRFGRSVKATVAAAALALAGIGTGSTAGAVTYTPDTLLFSDTLANSGLGTEIGALATYLGVDSDTLLPTAFKDETGFFEVDAAGNFLFDVAPNEPGYFILKFGVGNLGVPTHYFFQNIAELTKLVWTNNQVQGLMTNCADGFRLDDDDESACRLSHITTAGTTVIPLPAAGWLLLGGLGALGFAGRRRRKQAA